MTLDPSRLAAIQKPLAIIDDRPKEPDFECAAGADELRSKADVVINIRWKKRKYND